jgi:hypothetical protein
MSSLKEGYKLLPPPFPQLKSRWGSFKTAGFESVSVVEVVEKVNF